MILLPLNLVKRYKKRYTGDMALIHKCVEPNTMSEKGGKVLPECQRLEFLFYTQHTFLTSCFDAFRLSSRTTATKGFNTKRPLIEVALIWENARAKTCIKNALLFGRSASPRPIIGYAKKFGLRDMSFKFWSGNHTTACACLSQFLKVPCYSWERKCQLHSFNVLASCFHRIIIADSFRQSLGCTISSIQHLGILERRHLPNMHLSTEAIIAIVSLIVAAPCTGVLLWTFFRHQPHNSRTFSNRYYL